LFLDIYVKLVQSTTFTMSSSEKTLALNNTSALVHEVNYLRNQMQKQAIEIKESKAKFENTPFEKFKKKNNRGKTFFKLNESNRPRKEHEIWLFY
jgi:hypothetical protein